MMDDELCGYDRAMKTSDYLPCGRGLQKPRAAVVGSGLGSVAGEEWRMPASSPRRESPDGRSPRRPATPDAW